VDISVELFGQLSPDLPRRHNLNLPPRATVQEAAALLGLNFEEIGLITINGVQSEMSDTLPPDCRLCFFSYLSGG
jgi:hypothetical protein